MFEALLDGLFPNHEYGQQTTIGTIDHLKNPSLKKIREYYNKYYVPNNMAICLSGNLDCIMFVNEMNKYPNLDKDLQYSFYLNTLRKKKRFSPWLRKDKVTDLQCVKQYYGYSNEKASQALKILSKQQLEFIKQKLEIGGTK